MVDLEGLRSVCGHVQKVPPNRLPFLLIPPHAGGTRCDRIQTKDRALCIRIK
jgi:hypothetical protein